MASTDALPIPMRGVAYRHYFCFRDNTGAIVTSVTGADSEISKDGASFADATNEFTEIGTSGPGYLDLTATNMDAQAVYLKATCTNTNAIPYDTVLYPVGSCPALGIIDAGVAQAVSATTLQLRSAAAFADDSLIGATLLLTDGANIGATAIVTDYAGSTDTATIVSWSNGATPSGTPAYVVFGTSPASSGTVNANVVQISGDSTAADNLEAYTDGTTRMPVNVKAVADVVLTTDGSGTQNIGGP